jgi:hypothetical protein
MFGVTEKLPLQGTEPELVGPDSVQLDASVAEVVSMSDCPMAMFAAEAVSVTVGGGGWLLTVEAVLPPHPARNTRLTIPKITCILVSTALLFMTASRLLFFPDLIVVALPLIA